MSGRKGIGHKLYWTSTDVNYVLTLKAGSGDTPKVSFKMPVKYSCAEISSIVPFITVISNELLRYSYRRQAQLAETN